MITYNVSNDVSDTIAPTQEAQIQAGRVTTEGDDLYYEVRGQGQPLLMIPGGGGDSFHYHLVAERLADEYKVICFDRRANSRSSINFPQNFEVSQQSRDAVAVLHAVGETSAFVFGNSSGAVIALDMAKTQPQAVRAVIAHEPPIPRVLPDARKWQRFFASVYKTAFRFSSSLAALQFFFGIQIPVRKLLKATYDNAARQRSGEQRIGKKEATDFLVMQELLPITNYLPDVERIKQNGVKVFIALGEWGLAKKTWYARVGQILVQQLGCELVTVPGHHGSFMDMPDEWAAALRGILNKSK